jgi:hypothetical protein
LFSFVTNFLEPVALLFYVAGFAIYRSHGKMKETQVLFIYYILMTTLQLLASINVKLGFTKEGNIWQYEIAGFLTATFIGYYFYRLLNGSVKKKVILLLISSYLLYAVFRQFTIEGRRLFDSVGYSLLSASIAIYVFMYFHQLLKNVSEVSILKDFNFWLASSYLVYFVGGFIIFVSYYYLTTKIIKTYTQPERDLLTALWGLHNVLLFLGALSLLTGSLWITYRRKSV